MGGEIIVESEYGAGTAFTAVIKQKLVSDVVHIGETVARHLESFDYADSKRSSNAKLVRVKLPYARVLVVDDVPTNRDVAKGILKPYAMTVDCVTNGAAAIELIRAGEPRYNAIFMDHMMPGMDGIEATRIIRREIGTEYARAVPILALTANAIVGNEQIFLDHGFQAFLSKPIDIFAMDAAIRQWIRDKTLEHEPAAEQEPDSPRERWAGPDRRARNERRSGLDRRALNAGIEGIDWKLGLDRFGGDEESYINVLRSYAKNTPPLLDQVRNITEANLPDYAIVVHGIKSSSLSIGAEQIGNLAERLENASKGGDLAFVLSNNNLFIGIAERLLRGLSEYLLKFDGDHPREQKDAPDPDILRELAQSCREYDIDGIDAAMGKLDAYSYANGADLTEWIHEQIRVSGFRAVAERLEPEEQEMGK
jgi:CheY-like chemotaxis protein/HPt (histidine-containing phosphotransfer) domain-containing protein